MARHDIRGLKLSDGTYSLTSKDVYNLNDNFIQLSQEVFGNSNFSKDLGKQVKKNTASIEAITSTVGDLEADYTQVIQDVDNLSLAVVAADGRALNAQAKADSVEITFKSTGGMNYVENGKFGDGINGYDYYWMSGTGSYNLSYQNNEWTGYEPALEMVKGTPDGGLIVVKEIKGLTPGKTYTVGCLLAGHRATNLLRIVNQADSAIIGSSNEVTDGYGGSISGWQIAKITFVATDSLMRLRFYCNPNAVNGYLWAKHVRCNEGTELLPYSQHPNEAYGITHKLTSQGYEMKDSNGEMLLTPNGVANEQNIGRVDNVEAGYPMKIPFHIGAEVSQITQAVLKWDMSNFRTYSKGAASGGGVRTTPSGGGSTSGPSSKTTADNSGPATFVSNTQTELSYPNEGKHYHRITAEQMTHSHGMAHTHTTPSHSHSLDITHEHAPVFGILETGITVDHTVGIEIDGVYRAQPNATRGIIDLSTWITTNGWHELILYVNGIKRLDANLFLKTYIRR